LPFLPALRAALTNSNAQPSLANWPRIQDGIEHDVQKAIEGKATAADSAQSIEDTLRDVLGK
jgi:hypothetical protein